MCFSSLILEYYIYSYISKTNTFLLIEIAQANWVEQTKLVKKRVSYIM